MIHGNRNFLLHIFKIIVLDCHETGIDYNGNDVGNIPNANLDLCDQACKDNENCQFYSFNTLNGKCWLKHSRRGKTVNEGTVSGSKRCYKQGKNVCMYEIDCPYPTTIERVPAHVSRQRGWSCGQTTENGPKTLFVPTCVLLNLIGASFFLPVAESQRSINAR